MKLPVFLLLLMGGALAAGCARDCQTMAEQRCKAAQLSDADCRQLAARAAGVPAQACEAVLQALESRGAVR